MQDASRGYVPEQWDSKLCVGAERVGAMGRGASVHGMGQSGLTASRDWDGTVQD